MLALLAACSATGSLPVDEMGFVPSEMEAVAFFEAYTTRNIIPRTLSGRATVQVSEPGQSERVSVQFRSDHSQSLLLVSNNLGMEGGRIHSDPDSVTVYNRIEKVAHRMSRDDAARFYLNGIGAMNLIRILYPFNGPSEIAGIYENDDYFLVETIPGERHLLSRDSMLLRRTERRNVSPEAYHTFEFTNHAEREGYRLPRRIRIVSYDGKSHIFLVIRSLQTDPADLDFDPGIPDNIEFIRI